MEFGSRITQGYDLQQRSDMPMRRALIVVLLQLFAVSAYAHELLQSSAQFSKWSYVKEVIYLAPWRSINSVTLQDDGDLELRFGTGKLTNVDIDKWPRGKHLNIAYSAEDGAVLLDPDSGKFALIISGLQQHPIDIMTDRCLQTAGTTSEIVKCHAEELGFWDKEMNRFYTLVLASLSPEQRQAVQTSQREWLRFRDAQKAAAAAVFTHGTMSRITAAIEITNTTKEQAQRLARYLAQ
jgi:uncharacterized protein YecT (DUF1311 family)